MNRVELAGRVAESEPLRHTPAGTPVLRVRMTHESEILEAGATRRVRLDLSAVALGEAALALAALRPETDIFVTGFLAPLRQGSDRLVLHIQSVSQAQ